MDKRYVTITWFNLEEEVAEVLGATLRDSGAEELWVRVVGFKSTCTISIEDEDVFSIEEVEL